MTKESHTFTPKFKRKQTRVGVLTGVSVRGLPLDIPVEEIRYFLESKGLPPGHEEISVNRTYTSTTIDVDNLNEIFCTELTDGIDGKEFFEKILKVKGIQDIKSEDASEVESETEKNKSETQEANDIQELTPKDPAKSLSNGEKEVDPTISKPETVGEKLENKLDQLVFQD